MSDQDFRERVLSALDRLEQKYEHLDQKFEQKFDRFDQKFDQKFESMEVRMGVWSKGSVGSEEK